MKLEVGKSLCAANHPQGPSVSAVSRAHFLWAAQRALGLTVTSFSHSFTEHRGAEPRKPSAPTWEIDMTFTTSS